MKPRITRLTLLLASMSIAALTFGQAVTSSITGTVRDASPDVSNADL
ncbi:MAG: hypothetical protein ACRD3T_15510 [Terriglobia bacterium]